jgi:hypothetical protein
MEVHRATLVFGNFLAVAAAAAATPTLMARGEPQLLALREHALALWKLYTPDAPPPPVPAIRPLPALLRLLPPPLLLPGERTLVGLRRTRWEKGGAVLMAVSGVKFYSGQES